jgi:hypothetical protein
MLQSANQSASQRSTRPGWRTFCRITQDRDVSAQHYISADHGKLAKTCKKLPEIAKNNQKLQKKPKIGKNTEVVLQFDYLLARMSLQG